MLRRLLQRATASGCITAEHRSVSRTLDGIVGACSSPGGVLSSLAGEAQQALQDATQCVFIRSKYTYKFKKAATMPGLIYWQPRTPGLRHKISIDYEYLGIYTGAPHKDLSAFVHKTGGRNNTGRITCWHHGGGERKVLRQVDFSRTGLDGVPGVVQRLEHDPNRSGFLALVRYEPEGQLPLYKYHLAPADLRPGDILMAGAGAPIRPGNVLPLRDIPLGVPISSVELRPGDGGQLARSANTSAVIQAKQDKYAIVRLPSTETRLVDLDCRAAIGVVSNHLQKLVNLGKAGESRRRGIRPTVRGIAMNPIDHPHGGRTNGGRPSCSPWGIYCKGKRTRRRNNPTNSMILIRKGGQTIDKFVQAKKWRAKLRREEKERNQAGNRPAQQAGPTTAAAAGGAAKKPPPGSAAATAGAVKPSAAGAAATKKA